MSATIDRSAPSAAPTRTAASYAEATGTMIVRSVRHSIRNVDALVTAIILPTILMLLFTFVFGGALESGGNYVQYVVPGIILLCAGFGASSTAVDVADDLSNGIIDRFRTMPIRAYSVLLGHVVASLARNLLATGVVIAVGLLVGFRPSATPIEWLATVGIIALYILAITWVYAAVGLAAKSVEAASGLGFVLLFLPYLSSAFVPIDTMPTWLQWFSRNQPITPITETIRSLLTGSELGINAWLAVGWSVLIIVGAYLWGAWLFKRKAAKR
jgi:ABC-2 type transport system permease protein